MTRHAQQAAQRLTQAFVIVNDGNEGWNFWHRGRA
jgi:hypothetical protein